MVLPYISNWDNASASLLSILDNPLGPWSEQRLFSAAQVVWQRTEKKNSEDAGSIASFLLPSKFNNKAIDLVRHDFKHVIHNYRAYVLVRAVEMLKPYYEQTEL